MGLGLIGLLASLQLASPQPKIQQDTTKLDSTFAMIRALTPALIYEGRVVRGTNLPFPTGDSSTVMVERGYICHIHTEKLDSTNYIGAAICPDGFGRRRFLVYSGIINADTTKEVNHMYWDDKLFCYGVKTTPNESQIFPVDADKCLATFPTHVRFFRDVLKQKALSSAKK